MLIVIDFRRQKKGAAYYAAPFESKLNQRLQRDLVAYSKSKTMILDVKLCHGQLE